jgi:two-component system, OmpR family, sensor histidine kinase BaeS
MKNSLSRRITLAMVLLAVGGIVLTALLSSLALSWNFNRYLRQAQMEQNRLIMDTLAELYAEATSWSAIRRSTMHLGSTTGTQIRVFDNEGRLIADSLPAMMQGMQGRRWQQAQDQRGQSYEYPFFVRRERVGTVEITHLGQEGMWSGEAVVFRRTVRQSALLTGLAAILAAALAGAALSRRLTRRLGNLTTVAELWGHGRLDARAQVDGDDELAVLGETMNRMANRLEEQSNLRKKLTGDISHELRTPLTTIQSYLEAFQDQVLEPDERNIRAILDESHRLGHLVNDLQELTNSECRSRDAALTGVELRDFTAAEAERARPLFVQQGIRLETAALEGEPVTVQADPYLLGRVLVNLLVNALKYTPAGGQVTVGVFNEPGRAGVTVADTGIGIAPEHLPYIFERFYRADPSRARSTGGSGIGLAIVKELVEAMGGWVDVTSEPGQGSTFRVVLPRPAAER